MTPWCNVSTALLGACVLISGCSTAGQPEDVVIDPVSVPYTTLEFPESQNGLSPADFWDSTNQQALRTLGGAALLDSSGALVATPLLSTAGGRSVLNYLFRCALTSTTTIQSAGGAYSFDGDFGFAQGWLSRALTTSEQRWLTSCMLVHLNGVGASVPILLVGNYPTLIPKEGDDFSDFSIKDMTVFGNLFATSPKAYVCTDLGLDLACGGLLNTYVLERLCDAPLLCNITFLGACNLPLVPVCTYDANGYPTCSAGLPSTTYAESIATWLTRSGGLTLYPLCSL